MKGIRVGFVGAGWICGEHAKALVKLPDVKVAAVSTRQTEKAEAFSREYTEGAPFVIQT